MAGPVVVHAARIGRHHSFWKREGLFAAYHPFVVTETDAPTTPGYALGGASEPLELYTGPGRLDDIEDRVHLSLVWEPRPTIRALLESPPDAMSYFDAPEVVLSVPELGLETEVFVTRSGTGPVHASLHKTCVGDHGPANSVVFHVVNFPYVFGGAEHLREGHRGWLGRWRWAGGGWIVTLDSRQQAHQLQEELRREGGYAFTHVGRLEAEDGVPFTMEAAQHALQAVAATLAFCAGRWSPPLLPVAYDINGRPVWRELAIRHCDEWSGGLSWLDPFRGEAIAAVGSALLERWSDECWRQALWRVIGMYVEANGVGRRPPFVDTRLIVAQTALELLAWLIVDNGCDSPLEVKPSGTASERIRTLAQRIHVGGDFPDAPLNDLVQFAAQEQCDDAPHTLTRVRNYLTHPRRRGGAFIEPSRVLRDAWLLSVWYVELVLLHLFGYRGMYGSRLKLGRYVGDVEAVPWV